VKNSTPKHEELQEQQLMAIYNGNYKRKLILTIFIAIFYIFYKGERACIYRFLSSA